VKQEGLHLLAKQVLDRVVGACALVAAAPICGLAALVVRSRLGSPVLFSQARPGRGGRPFTIYKFRTMTDARDETGNPLPDHQRMHPVGEFLRKYSIDELPQLWNVVRGDLSLVGPRPLLMQYLPRYSPRQARRHEVLPGITGWAQVNGRNALDWPAKFELDVWYVENWSLLLDLEILLRTTVALFARDSISHGGHVTMPEFMGPSPSTIGQTAEEA